MDKTNKGQEIGSFLGILFESGFKTRTSEILNKPLSKNKIVIPDFIPEKGQTVYFNLGQLVADLFISPLKDKEIIETSEMVEFNEGKYPLGDYRNADFYSVWVDNNRQNAMFIELTKEGDTLKGNNLYKPSDVSLSITENLTFKDYFEEILTNTEKIYQSLPSFAFGELKKLLQLLIYASDFMLKRFIPDCLELLILYPVKDAFKLSFSSEKLIPPDAHTLERAKKLLKELRQPKTLKEFEFKGGFLHIVPKRKISKVRESVKNFLFENSRTGNAVVLLHSPATGKTTSTLKLVNSLAEQKPILFVYFSSRTAIVDSVSKRLEENGFSVFSNKGGNLKTSRKDYAKYSFLEKEGNLKNIRKAFQSSNIPPKSAITTTFHSIVKTKFSNTLTHLLAMLKLFLKKYPQGEIVIAVDEILGLENGFSAYRDLLDALKKESLINKTRIVVFDASVYSGKTFEEEYFLKKHSQKAIPPHLTPSKYTPSYKTVLEDIEHICGFEASFPAKSLTVHHIPFPFPSPSQSNNKELKDKAFRNLVFLIGSKGFKGGVGIFAQSNAFLMELKQHLLSVYGNDIEDIVFINSVKKPEIKTVKNRVFLFTSALSRGIDLPVENFFIFAPSFNVETNLAEILQVFYRIRDGKTDEVRDKTVNVIHLLAEEEENGQTSIISQLKQSALMNLINQLLEAYINPSVDKVYKIPFPALKENIFEPTLMSFIDRLRTLQLYVETNNIQLRPVYKDSPLFDVSVVGWIVKQPPKILYPFAVFNRTNLKILIRKNIDTESWSLLKERIKNDRELTFTVKKQLLEFIEQFRGNKLQTITQAPVCIFLPNTVIPTAEIEQALKKINSIGRVGISFYPYRVYIENRLLRDFFDVKHNEDIIGFFPSEVLSDYLSLPQIPLIYFARPMEQPDISNTNFPLNRRL